MLGLLAGLRSVRAYLYWRCRLKLLPGVLLMMLAGSLCGRLASAPIGSISPSQSAWLHLARDLKVQIFLRILNRRSHYTR